MITYATVQEARQQQSAGGIYLDVRSIPEYEQAHPAGAYNVPWFHLDPRTRQMHPNPEFLAVVQANFPPDTRLLVGCHAGVRSAQACGLLESAGYQNLVDVSGGFGGSPMGETGWVQAGLPIEAAADVSTLPPSSTDRSYDALLARAAGKGC